MNILLHGKLELLPAEQITLDTPEALLRDLFIHLSLCGRCEGQGIRIQTHWNRHGGIWEYMKLPNWKPNKSNLGNLIKKLPLLLSNAVSCLLEPKADLIATHSAHCRQTLSANASFDAGGSLLLTGLKFQWSLRWRFVEWEHLQIYTQ